MKDRSKEAITISNRKRKVLKWALLLLCLLAAAALAAAVLAYVFPPVRDVQYTGDTAPLKKKVSYDTGVEGNMVWDENRRLGTVENGGNFLLLASVRGLTLMGTIFVFRTAQGETFFYQ